MITINPQWDNELEWTVYKGLSKCVEDFTRSKLMLFAVSLTNKIPLIIESADEGCVKTTIPAGFEIPTGLTKQTYDTELIWIKNGRDVNRTYQYNVFKVDALSGLDKQTVKIKSTALVYGYDGLSSYELAALLGKLGNPPLSLDKWVENASEANEKIEDLSDELHTEVENRITADTNLLGQIDDLYANKANKNGSPLEDFEANKIIANAIKNPLDSNSDGVKVPIAQTNDEYILTTSDGKNFGCLIRYDSTEKRIYLFNNDGQIISSIDATDFIKDGMVDNVYVDNGNLVITFITKGAEEPEKETITIPLTDIFDPNNYYTTVEVDAKLDKKADQTYVDNTFVQKSEFDNEVDNLWDLFDVVENTMLPLKADLELITNLTSDWNSKSMDPTSDNKLTTQSYVDGQVSTKLSLSGGKMSGDIDLDDHALLVRNRNNESRRGIQFTGSGNRQGIYVGDGHMNLILESSASSNLWHKYGDNYVDILTSINTKRINGNSIYGSGNIDINNVFKVIYGETHFEDTVDAYNAGKFIYAEDENGIIYNLYQAYKIGNNIAEFDFINSYADGHDVTWFEYNSSGFSELYEYTLQDYIDDLPNIRSGAAAGATAYQKPSTGIPERDIEQGVIPDVSNFITRSVNDLANYYLKSETYTKSEIDDKIGAIQQFHYEIYASLQDITTPATNVLYLIGPTGSGNDRYEEYVYANNDFVKIGDTSIDLSGYVTTQALNTALANYVTSSALTTALAAKQDTLESGTNIKSINGNSILGEGNLDVNNVFIATYNQTSINDLNTAYTDGKLLVVVGGVQTFLCQRKNVISENNWIFRFAGIDNGDRIQHIDCITYNNGTTWTWTTVTTEKTTSVSSTSTDNQLPTAKAVYDFVQASAQPQTAIYNVQPNTTTLDANVETYYNFLGTVDSFTITLPLMTTATTTLKNIIFNLTCGDTPAIVINGAEVTTDETQDVVYFANYLIEANKSYEINALWNGSKWVIGAAEITIPTEVEEVEE